MSLSSIHLATLVSTVLGSVWVLFLTQRSALLWESLVWMKRSLLSFVSVVLDGKGFAPVIYRIKKSKRMNG